MLAPGETKTVAIDLPVSQLAYWDVKTSAWVVEPISYAVSVGGSSRDLPQTAKLTVAD
jgi:beta-glucosidase